MDLKSLEKKKKELDERIENKRKERYRGLSPLEKKNIEDRSRKRKTAAIMLIFMLIGILYIGKTFIAPIVNSYVKPINQEESTEEVGKPKIYVGYNEDYDQEYIQDGQVRQGTITDGAFEFAKIPEFNGEDPYYVLNGNRPYFNTEELNQLDIKDIKTYEKFADLDDLDRVGVCESVIGQDLMPTEKRGSIGHVKPSGWNQKRYDNLIKDKYLYNRCHLIGFQLTGENDNVKNLMTGTRFFNVDGMLPFENEVASYVKETGNRVKFRVTPVFVENELVARGLIMEAYSIEDKGKGVCYNVFVYNAQPGIKIDYSDGSSKEK